MKYYRFWLNNKEHDDKEFTRKKEALNYFLGLIKRNKYHTIQLEREWSLDEEHNQVQVLAVYRRVLL